jgi:hypothetical protein
MAQAEQQLQVQAASSNEIRILLLGEALFQTIGMQLSVEKYKAISVDRGASLDTLNYPLNDREWLRDRFAAIRQMSSEEARRAALQRILNWTNAGPGGCYDDLGNPALEPHLVRGPGFRDDPAAVVSPRADFEEDEDMGTARVARRLSWIDHAESLYDAPLRMRYTGLDDNATYKIRVVYGGDDSEHRIRLVANQGVEIHPFIAKPNPIEPIEFEIPKGVISNGELNLAWSGEQGLGGNGRVCEVSEVWLIRNGPPTHH